MFATTSQPITIVSPLAAAKFMVIDIETGDAPPDAIADAIAAWRAPSNWKTETVEAKRREAAEKIVERAALLDASPILCCALQTDHARLVMNGMDQSAPEINEWPVMPCGDERGLLIALRAWMDTCTAPETTIVGHNIHAFDLPKIRNAYIRHSLRLPTILTPRSREDRRIEVVDTAALFKAFSMEHRDDFCPRLDAIAMAFGIPRPKEYMSGADCPRLYSEGQIAAILTYCAVDVATTARIYQLMTSTAQDIE